MILWKRLRTSRYRRFVYLCFVVTGAALNLLPRRVVFWLLVLTEVGRLRGRGRFYRAYWPYVTSYLAEHPDFRFSTGVGPRLLSSSVRVLDAIGAHREL